MASQGLNKAKREIVRGLMDRGISDNEIADDLQHISGWDSDWDYDKNVKFCRELARDGYLESAEKLEWMINK